MFLYVKLIAFQVQCARMILHAADVLMAMYSTKIAALLILIVFVVKMLTSRKTACVFVLELKAVFNVQKIVMPI